MKKLMTSIAMAAIAAVCSSTAFAGTTDNLPGGIVVKHITKGTGANPTANDTVVVHYKGTLDDGSEFDSSYKRGTPATFPLKNVIPCWTQGIQKMAVGGEAKLTCPADTAYGNRALPGIPAGSTLNFEVKLLSVKTSF